MVSPSADVVKGSCAVVRSPVLRVKRGKCSAGTTSYTAGQTPTSSPEMHMFEFKAAKRIARTTDEQGRLNADGYMLQLLT